MRAAAVAPESCVALLRAMVGFDTVNSAISGRPDAEVDLAVWLEGTARAMGFPTRRLPVNGRGFNLLIAHEVSPRAPWVLFESHLDTVSVNGMTVPPFAAEVRDGRVWGRGACDTKGTGASMLWALGRQAESGSGPNNVALLYTVDEEVSKTGIATFVERQLPELGWRPGGIVVGEPTSLVPVVAHNGVLRWTIETRGVAAHSCNPATGKSAISMMARVIEAIESEYIPGLSASHPLTGRAQASINVIRGGVQANIIPESCEIVLDRRVVPGEDWRAVLPAVERVLDGVRRRNPGLEVVQGEPTHASPPLDPEVGRPFARFVEDALRGAGLPAEPAGVQYCTDASEASAAGLPAVVLGPGSIEQAHTRDEWLDIAELERAVDAYLAIMRSPL